MCYHGNWGTICNDNGFDSLAASVACNQLGFSLINASVLHDDLYSIKYSPIWLSNVRCIGNESHINNCTHLPVGQLSSSCYGHSQDVVIYCKGTITFNKLCHF